MYKLNKLVDTVPFNINCSKDEYVSWYRGLVIKDAKAWYSEGTNSKENDWVIISEKSEYTPTKDDINRLLRATVSDKSQILRQYVTFAIEFPNTVSRKWVEYNQNNFQHKFTVMSYNILAENYCSQLKYSTCPAYALEWRYRYRKILQEIKEYSPDIIGFQEMVNKSYENDFVPYLEDYDSIYIKRPNFGKYDGCGLFFKKDKFKMVENVDIDHNKIKHLEGIPVTDYATYNVGIISCLKFITKEDEKPFHIIVANTHIYWDPYREDVKILQTYNMLNQMDIFINKLKNENQIIPNGLVLVGDFNSLPTSSVYEFIKNKDLPSSVPKSLKLGYLKHNFTLKSAYEKENEPLTNITRDFKGCLDYIWYDESLELLKAKEVVNPETHKPYLTLPNPYHPSDHLPIMAEFGVKLKQNDIKEEL